MIQAIIIDDEDRSRSILSTLLQRYCPEISVSGTAANIDEGARLIDMHKPGIVFLDITMPGGTGFDLLNELSSVTFETIFITAHSEYAIKAIKADAVDYLLKPLNIQELQQAVQRAIKRLQSKTFSAAQHEENITDKKSSITGRITVPVNDGLQFIALGDIVRLSAKGSYTQIFITNNKQVLSSKPLKDYEQILSPTQFFRAHHSHIINLEYIKHYHRGDGGFVTMTDGSVIDIAKRKKKEFLELFPH